MKTFAALIDDAKLLIGVDSAPAHMAAALQTPEVILFGATIPGRWRPWENNASRVVISPGAATSANSAAAAAAGSANAGGKSGLRM